MTLISMDSLKQMIESGISERIVGFDNIKFTVELLNDCYDHIK